MAEDDYMFCVNTLNDMRKLPNELKGKNRVQRISLFFHFTMLRFNFSPVEIEENNNNNEGGEGSSSSSSSSSSPSPSQTTTGNKNSKEQQTAGVKAGWNSPSNGGVYSFHYSHPSLSPPSSVVHMKILPMDHLLLVHSTSSSSSDPSSLFSLEINMNEYISEYMTENEGEYKWKALQLKFKNAIVYSLLPSLKPPSPSPSPPPSRPPYGPMGDPMRISEPKQSFFSPFAQPSVSPYNVGYNDAFPNFSGGFGGSGGGMQVGPNHQIFNNYPVPSPPPLYYGNDHDDDDDVNFHFNPLPSHSPYSPLPPGNPQTGIPQGPSPRFDPVGPLPSQNDKNNNKKDKRSPYGPDPDHLPMPGANKDWYI